MSVGCPICQETFRDVKSCVVTRCGHAFDEHCVLDWIQRSRTCPSCRAPCNAHCLTKVFFSLVPDDSEAAEELRQRLEASEVKAAIFFSRNEISKKKLMDMEMDKEWVNCGVRMTKRICISYLSLSYLSRILIRDNKDQQLRMENSELVLKKEIKQLNGKIKQLENTHKQKMGCDSSENSIFRANSGMILFAGTWTTKSSNSRWRLMSRRRLSRPRREPSSE